MKKLFLILSLITFGFSFSQSETKTTSDLPLFLEFITPIKIVHYKSNAISDLSRFHYTIDNLESKRQGHFVISTNSFRSSFARIHPVPSLNSELNKIMYTGNNFNPQIGITNFDYDYLKNSKH